MEEEVGVTVPAYLSLQTKFCFGQPTFKKRDKQHKWQGNTFPLKNTERKEDKTPKSVCPGVEQRQHHSCTCHVKTNTKWRYAGNCTGKFLWDIKKKNKKHNTLKPSRLAKQNRNPSIPDLNSQLLLDHKYIFVRYTATACWKPDEQGTGSCWRQ